MKRVLFLGLFLCGLAGTRSYAVVRHVPSEYGSIQQGIMAAEDGDTVLVAPGIYYETINFSGKDIVVTSTDPNDPKVVGYTIINAEQDGTVVTFENRESREAVLTGFTITGGVGTLSEWSDETWKEFYGAGIFCTNGASPTITRNVITKNVSPYSRELVDMGGYQTYLYEYSYGGGIGCNGGSPIITYNVIYNNSAYSGGGIYNYSGSIVANNLIYGNSAGDGGGLTIGRGFVVNNTIVGNDTSLEPENGWGGNVYATFSSDYTDLVIANNIIAGAASGGGLFCREHRSGLIRYNNVWDNMPANYGLLDERNYEAVFTDAVDETGQNGNISDDPLFAVPWGRDYHLQPLSPCISAGDPNPIAAQGTEDMDGDPRVFALRVDIGADEHVGYVKPLAEAGADQHVLLPGSVTLDGTGSYFADSDGVTTYQWEQTEGPAAELSDVAAARPDFVAPSEGYYRFALVVGDDQYTSAADEVLVVVGNEAPVAVAGDDALWPVPGYVVLDGSGSHDADPPDEVTYQWTQTDGPSVELLDPQAATSYFIAPEAGIYVFELVVNDGFAASEPDTVTIEATPFTLNAEEYVVASREGDDELIYAAVAGTKVVYCSTSWDNYGRTVYCTDARSGEPHSFKGAMTNLKPQIDGDLMVWAGGTGRFYQPMTTRLYMANLSTGEDVSLKPDRSDESYGYPAVSGNTVVYLRHRQVDMGDQQRFSESAYDIWGLDITDFANPTPFLIAETAGHGNPYPADNYYYPGEDFVDVDGHLVVWEADGDIYGADISDLSAIKVFPICTAPERQSDPAISGHVVVWVDERDDAGDIYAADISDPDHVREFVVDRDRSRQLQPDIDGTLIVYIEGGDSGGRILMASLSKQYGVVPLNLPGYSYGAGPQIDGASVAWQDWGEQIMGMSVEYGYALAEGSIQNVTSGQAYETIQHALSTATDGDVIQLEPGTYREKIWFCGNNVTLTSTDPEDPAVRDATVITGGGQLVTFADGETSDCLLTGLTITGGSFGVYCGHSTPTITHCAITGNQHAGVKLWDRSDPTIRQCDITANGAGVEMWAYSEGRNILRSTVMLRNCVLAGNRLDGIFGGNPNVENCTIADNLGFGLNCVQPTATHSIIYGNHNGGENVAVKRTPTLTYCDIQGGWPGQGNFDLDPHFVAPGDYHLKSEGWSWQVADQTWTWDDVTSPCIDAGDPSLPLGAEEPCTAGPLSERAVNTALNIGAYGGTPQASLAPREEMP